MDDSPPSPAPFGRHTLDDPALGIVEAFEQAWEVAPPDIADFWSRHPQRPLRLLLELSAIDLENRLKRGQPAAAEDYESRFPELAADPATRQELRRVAQAFRDRSGDTPDVTEALPADRPAQQTTRRPAIDTLVGTELGGVSIVRVIAEGGMGRVYEGRQQKPRRPVAVKVIRPGITSPTMLKRFEYEAQVLARLRHPGIAQIHSVGTHEVDGQAVPYFVMEYIPNAKPLTQYADERSLSTHDRLDLFRKVCEAVAHGHQKGVIHRDLKPANVLVDSSGQPKVIDFGVARSTDSDLALTTMQTDVGALVGTLQYMSPEQFDADPHDLDVRLDVYALGVILYELLAGKPPYEVKQRAIYEVARVVREEDPTPLSSMNKTLRRDVGIIAGKCLQKDKNRRYSSATELAGDVSRYLAGEPITAAPPTFRDAVARLARRHKAAAAAFVGIAVSLVAAVVGISGFAIRAERARTQAERAQVAEQEMRTVAERERDAASQARAAAKAEAITAKRQLYSATLYKLQAALDRPQRGAANEFYRDAEAAYRDAYGDNGSGILELTLLKPELDESLAVFRGHDGEITCMALSPDGSRIATGSLDNTARLWDAATGQLLAVFNGHESDVASLAFTPDGSRLATGSFDNTVRLWDAATGDPLAVLSGHEGGIESVVFSPDGSRLATGSSDHTARLWDAATGESLAVLEGHECGVCAIAFSPDGSRLATGGKWGKDGYLWDVASGDALFTLKNIPGGIACLAFSSDGSRLVAGCYDNTAKAWDTATGDWLYGFIGHVGGIECLALSPDGSRLVTGSSDQTARLWNTATGASLAVLKGHESDIWAVVFSPDGSRIATGSLDNTARLWDAATGQLLAVFNGHESDVFSLAFTPDGSRLVTGSTDETARVWDAIRGESLTTLEGHELGIECQTLSPDGSRIATGSLDDTARLWDASTGESLATLNGHKGPISEIAFSADGSRLATSSRDDTTRLWDMVTGDSLAVVRACDCLAFSPDGLRLATGSSDNTARLWNAATGEPLAVLQGHAGTVNCVVFSPDGVRLATGSSDKTVRLWAAATGDPLAVLSGHEGGIESVVFSPDGSRLATVSWDETARLWDTATGESLAVLRGHTRYTHAMYAIDFSPDGSKLATGSYDGTAQIWDAFTGVSMSAMKGHERYIACLAFSPDSSRLATGSEDKTARLWDTATGASLAVLKGHRLGITSLAFSPDGSRLATSSRDGSVRLHGLSNADLYSTRIATAAARRRLAPTVERWFTGDPSQVRANLAAAKESMPAEDWRVAANLVLILAPTMTAYESSHRQNMLSLIDLAASRWAWGDKAGAIAAQAEAVQTLDRAVQKTVALASSDDRQLVISYVRPDGNYDGWNLWIWEDGRDGFSVPFQPCELGVYASIPVGKDVSRLGYIVRQGDWLQKDVEVDRFIDIQPNGCTALWLTKGCEQGVDAASVAEARATLVRYEQETPPYGSPPIDIEADRRAAAERRSRLKPLIDDWFTGDLAAVKAKLTAARSTLPAEDWHVAANMVLEHASVLRASTPDHEPAEEGAGSIR